MFPKSRIITAQRLFDFCDGFFPCWKYTHRSLDEVVTRNDRDPRKGAYVVWFRYRVEADEELKNFSAEDLKEKKIKGICLPERLAMESEYHKRTGKHLDVNNTTLCLGSRDGDGVPYVDWSGGKMHVYWCPPRCAGGRFRVRQKFTF